MKTFRNYLLQSINFASVPFFYSDKEQNLLKNSNFACIVAERKKLLKKEYELLLNEGIIDQGITLENYIKARVIETAKNFKIKDPRTNNSFIVLMPFGDLINHHPIKSNSKIIMSKNGEIKVKATKEINQGEKIVVSYGNHSNYFYLLYYGFIEENNKYGLPIILDISLNNSGKYKNQTLISTVYGINRSLYSFREIALKGAFIKNKPVYKNPINIENEKKSLKMLKNGLAEYLANYPTTIKQDIEKLQRVMQKGINRNTNKYNILKILIEEKGILIKFYNAALIFHRILKRVQQNGEDTVFLTPKIAKMIERKTIMKNYLEVLIKVFSIKIELNTNGIETDNFDFGENEFLSENDDLNNEEEQFNINNLINSNHYSLEIPDTNHLNIIQNQQEVDNHEQPRSDLNLNPYDKIKALGVNPNGLLDSEHVLNNENDLWNKGNTNQITNYSQFSNNINNLYPGHDFEKGFITPKIQTNLSENENENHFQIASNYVRSQGY